MMKFFRNLRSKKLADGKVGKYFKYALGEVILIVIGVFIALQVNNWNQDYLSRKSAQKQLKELEINLLKDSKNLDTLQDNLELSLVASERLLNNFKLVLPTNDTTMSDIVALTFEYNFKPNQNRLLALINSEGILNLASEIQDRITSYHEKIKRIHEQENLSNNFIRDKYESHVFKDYSYIFGKGNPHPKISEFYKNDKRESISLKTIHFQNDTYLESLVGARKYQISEQLKYYRDAQKINERLINYIKSN